MQIFSFYRTSHTVWASSGSGKFRGWESDNGVLDLFGVYFSWPDIFQELDGMDGFVPSILEGNISFSVSIISQGYSRFYGNQIASVGPLLPFLERGDSVSTKNEFHFVVDLIFEKLGDSVVVFGLAVVSVDGHTGADSIYDVGLIGGDMVMVDLGEDGIDMHAGPVFGDGHFYNIFDDFSLEKSFAKLVKGLGSWSLAVSYE